MKNFIYKILIITVNLEIIPLVFFPQKIFPFIFFKNLLIYLPEKNVFIRVYIIFYIFSLRRSPAPGRLFLSSLFTIFLNSSSLSCQSLKVFLVIPNSFSFSCIYFPLFKRFRIKSFIRLYNSS